VDAEPFGERGVTETGSLDSRIECSGTLGDADFIYDRPASNVKRKAALIGGESWGHSFDPCLHVIFGYDDFPE